MKEWKDLSMREKHTIMKQYVSDNIQNGIYKGGGVLDVEQYYKEFAQGDNLFSGEENHSQNLSTPYVTTPAIPLFNTPRNWSTWTPQGEVYYQEHYDPYLKQAYSIYDGRTNSYKQPPLPEVVVTASNPAYSNNAEMQMRDGESENDYIERMSQLNKDRYDFAQGVRDTQRQYAGITGAALGTVGTMGLGATVVPTLFNIMTNPVVETAFGIDALHRQLGPDGYKKTINLFNQGDWRAIPSLGVDLMDLTMLGAGARGAYKTVNGAYDLTKQGLNWANRNYVRPYRLSRAMNTSINNTQITPNKMQPFINTEWYNLLMSKNGNNYYRLARTKELAGKNNPNGIFLSHTTPWEEFAGKPTGQIDVSIAEETNGTPILYEFPHSTFGDLKATGYTGLQAGYNDYKVADLGRQHLLFGDYSSGARGPVRLISDENAKLLEMDPFTIGVTERPLKPNGLYDTSPIYEDIYNGYQTAISPESLNNAIINSNYMLYERTPNGIQKTLHIGENPKPTTEPSASTIDFNTARTMQKQSQILGKAPKKYYNGDIEGERFGELISDEGSEKIIYQDAANPNRVLKVYDFPHDNIDKEFIPHPLVDEIHEGWVTTPDGKYYRVTSQPKYSNIPTSYTKEQENAIIKLLKDNGWEPYIDNESGRLELATKGENIMNDLGPGNIAFSNNGVPMIIDNNIINKKEGWNKGLTKAADFNNRTGLSAYNQNALGGPLFNSSSPIESFIGRKSQLHAVRYDDGGVKKTTARKVSFPEFLQKKGTEARATNIAALEQLQDSLIARKYPEAQRAAILATSYNEMDSRGGASRGVGGNGMMGLSKDRMPITLLGDTPEMRGKQIHHILEDLGTVHTGTHPQAGNWSDGGTGGPKIMSGQDGYNQFNSTTDAYKAAMILNKSYVRPRDRVPAWQNRGNDARLMQKYMHDDGGILEKIRQRLYTNIDPTMDYAYSIPAAIKAINGIDTHGMYPDETNMSNITGNLQVNRELWARYLQQPMTPITTRNSQYKPVGTEQTQIAVNPNVEDTQNFVNEATALPKFNRYYGSTVLGGYGMNNHAIAKAVDGYKGQYVAYRDTYDLNPFHGDRGIANIPGLSGLGDLSFGIGKPVPMYDRIYLDDYYGVNSMPQKDEYYGGYIPEVTVTPKKSTGGKLRTVRRLSTQF